jgi:hypothetical protein
MGCSAGMVGAARDPALTMTLAVATLAAAQLI